jgi:hypothetical protein
MSITVKAYVDSILEHIAADSKQEIAELIRAAYPNIYEWVIKLFTAFGV